MDEQKLNSSRSIKSISAKVQRENNYILHQQKKKWPQSEVCVTYHNVLWSAQELQLTKLTKAVTGDPLVRYGALKDITAVYDSCAQWYAHKYEQFFNLFS